VLAFVCLLLGSALYGRLLGGRPFATIFFTCQLALRTRAPPLPNPSTSPSEPKHLPFRTRAPSSYGRCQLALALLSLGDLALVLRLNRALGIPDAAFVVAGEALGAVLMRFSMQV